MHTQVEAIWAFVWVLSLGDQPDPRTLCPDDLVRRVPDLRTGESIEGWRERTGPRQRSADEVMRELDLHYGMTWGLADANLRRLPPPGMIDQYATWQRRRALEFAIAERDWTHDEWGHHRSLDLTDVGHWIGLRTMDGRRRRDKACPAAG